MMRLKLALIGVGLAGVGTGLCLVKTAPDETPQAGLFFDGSNFGLSASISF
jgi:hypothetical protein